MSTTRQIFILRVTNAARNNIHRAVELLMVFARKTLEQAWRIVAAIRSGAVLA